MNELVTRWQKLDGNGKEKRQPRSHTSEDEGAETRGTLRLSLEALLLFLLRLRLGP